MKPTIKMIAELSGVSRGTVDRVLNNRPNVKPNVRETVLAVMKEVNYTPNRAARALAYNGKERKVAIILPNWVGFFKTEVLRGIEDAKIEMRDFGMEVIVEKCETDSPEECIEKMNRLMEEEVLGIAICARNSILVKEKINELSERNIPVITFNSDIPESSRKCFVGQNPLKSGRVAGEIMSKCIHENDNILVIAGNLEFSAHKSRVNGFCDRLNELGIDKNRYCITECFNDYTMTYDKVFEAISLDSTVRAVYMASESVSACAEAIKRADKSYKIKVICNDVAPSTKNLLKEGWIDFTIEQNLYLQGYRPLMLLRDYLFLDNKLKSKLEYVSIGIINSENADID